MITDYVNLEWPHEQMPVATAGFVSGRYFWLFLALVLLLAVAYVLISRDRTSGMKLIKEKKPYKNEVDA